MPNPSSPALHIDPVLLEAAESVPRDETSLRQTNRAFVARALRSREDTERTGIYHRAETVHSELQQRLDARRKSFAAL